MTFAVMAILGHFSKSLLLFFIPQVFNFVYSLPQLFKVVPCPRHRMPDYDPVTDLLQPSTFSIERVKVDSCAPVEGTAGAGTVPPVAVSASDAGLRQRTVAASAKPSSAPAAAVIHGAALPDTPPARRYDNMTLINLVLRVMGPMHERTTTNVLLLLQVVCCALGLLLRYYWSPQVYEAMSLQPPEHTASGSTLAG